MNIPPWYTLNTIMHRRTRKPRRTRPSAPPPVLDGLDFEMGDACPRLTAEESAAAKAARARAGFAAARAHGAAFIATIDCEAAKRAASRAAAISLASR